MLTTGHNSIWNEAYLTQPGEQNSERYIHVFGILLMGLAQIVIIHPMGITHKALHT